MLRGAFGEGTNPSVHKEECGLTFVRSASIIDKCMSKASTRLLSDIVSPTLYLEITPCHFSDVAVACDERASFSALNADPSKLK